MCFKPLHEDEDSLVGMRRNVTPRQDRIRLKYTIVMAVGHFGWMASMAAGLVIENPLGQAILQSAQIFFMAIMMIVI